MQLKSSEDLADMLSLSEMRIEVVLNGQREHWNPVVPDENYKKTEFNIK